MYRLANNVELIEEPLDNGSYEYIVAVYNKNYKDYVVNKITYDFIKHFRESNTLKLVIVEYIKLTKAEGDQISIVTNQLTVFLMILLKKGGLLMKNIQLKTQYMRLNFREAISSIVIKS